MHSGYGSERGRFRRRRQAHDKSRSFGVEIVVTHDFSAMFADDSIADTEPQARSLSYFLGGEKWIENAIRIGNAGTVIAERDFHQQSIAGTHDLNPRRPAGFADRVMRVIKNVEEHLLQLLRVADYLGQRFVQPLDNLDAVREEIIRAQ